MSQGTPQVLTAGAGAPEPLARTVGAEAPEPLARTVGAEAPEPLARVPTSGASLYLHVPFCPERCPYCDFATGLYRRDLVQRYLAAVAVELDRSVSRLERVARARGEVVGAWRPRTVYFGGGTPTSLPAHEMGRLIDAVSARMDLSEVEEWTVEVNPGTLAGDKLELLLARGVNRVSLGVQSLDPRHLATLGRIHTVEDSRLAVSSLRAAGVGNLSLDLMTAVPGQTLADLEADLAGLVALEPEHISVYCLTYETGTPFARWRAEGRIRPAGEELEARMFERTVESLEAAGYRRYEISNFARPGFESRHNRAYWTGREFLGVGPGAGSGLDGERWLNIRSTQEWAGSLEAGGDHAAQRERLEPEAAAREALVLGLRLAEGVERDGFESRTGFDLEELLGARGLALIEQGCLAWDGQRLDGRSAPRRLALTLRGLLVADTVMAELV